MTSGRTNRFEFFAGAVVVGCFRRIGIVLRCGGVRGCLAIRRSVANRLGRVFASGLSAHLEALGEPDAKFPYWDEVTKIADGEWVWPARGIAIYLGTDPRFVRRVALFRATDLAGYVRSLQPGLRSYEGRGLT